MRRERRSLTQVGGPAAVWGDPEAGRALAECLDVAPAPKLEFTHGFHAYPGRMHPDTARRVLAALAAPGARVVDPFVGSGTVALEAMLAGCPFAGSDLLRVPLEIAWARTRVLRPAEGRRLAAAAARIANVGRERRFDRFAPPEWARTERDWYAPHTLREICAIRDQIDGVGEETLRRLLLCVLSSLLVKLSRQPSDSRPFAARSASPWPPNAAYRLFRDKAAELSRNLLRMAARLRKRRESPPEPRLVQADSRRLPFAPGSFDLAVTSPPYPGVYDYARHHGRRHPLYGAEPAGAEIGARGDIGSRSEGFEIYRADTRRWLEGLRLALAPGGRAAILIGDGVVGGRPVFADRLVRDLAIDLEFRIVAGASQPRADWTTGGRGRPRREHLVLLRAPAETHVG
jgi:hypothetical protein